MAGELVDSVRPRDLFRLNGASINDVDLVTRISMGGVRMPKSDVKGFSFVTTIPANITMATGLTFYWDLVDDGTDATDPGLAVRIGITVKKLNTGTATTDITVGAGTEQLKTSTLISTAGQILQDSLAIANANLNSAAVGDQILVRFRRLGTDAADTMLNAPLLFNIYVKNT